MPGTYAKRRTGLKDRAPRAAVPLPGVGGYDYPRGQIGETGFPGSTPASPRTKSQGSDGRLDRQLTATANQAEWATLPTRRANGTPRQPYARQMRSTAPEERMTPVIGGAPGSQNVRNRIAQRYKARPELVRAYTPAPNPGKTGAALNAPAQYHPQIMVHGHPDGKPVPGMDSNPGIDSPVVVVQSRYVSDEGAMEGYAVNRPLLFAKGGPPAAYPSSYVRFTGNQHLRGGRLTGQRYYGAVTDQQQIGLPTDAYGLSRARGPRHRPVKFEQPQPWTAHYYDAPPETTAHMPDMIRQSPTRPRKSRIPRRG